jgi:hypothetical protein
MNEPFDVANAKKRYLEATSESNNINVSYILLPIRRVDGVLRTIAYTFVLVSQVVILSQILPTN